MRSLYNNNYTECFQPCSQGLLSPHPKVAVFERTCFQFSITSTLRFMYRRIVINFLLSFLWNFWLQPKFTSFCKIYYNFIALLPLMSNNHSVAWFFLGVAFFCFIYVLDTQVVIHNMNVFIGSIDVWKTVPLETQGLYMTWSPILNI